MKDENDIVGYASRTSVDVELGKHIDLLTGLYKNEYLLLVELNDKTLYFNTNGINEFNLPKDVGIMPGE